MTQQQPVQQSGSLDSLDGEPVAHPTASKIAPGTGNGSAAAVPASAPVDATVDAASMPSVVEDSGKNHQQIAATPVPSAPHTPAPQQQMQTPQPHLQPQPTQPPLQQQQQPPQHSLQPQTPVAPPSLQPIAPREIPRSATFHPHAPALSRSSHSLATPLGGPASAASSTSSSAAMMHHFGGPAAGMPGMVAASGTMPPLLMAAAPPAQGNFAAVSAVAPAAAHQLAPTPQPSSPQENGVNYTSGGAVSITKSYADVSERCYGKVGRWIQKLAAPNVVQEYCLNQTAEIESASKKFLAMCKGLRDAIEYEWIEEDAATVQSGRKETSPDVDMTDATSAPAAPPATSRRRSTAASAAAATHAIDDKMLMMHMPVPSKGRQAPLNSAFKIRKLPPLTKNKVLVRSTENFRICLYCSVPIWNRGWTCQETLAAGTVEVEGHHCCSGCFAEGLVCQSRHTMVMVERYDMAELMKRYRDAVHTYNTILYPARRMYGHYGSNPPGIDLQFTAAKMVVDEYAESDPRPQLGRSEVTVSYHLNLRNILEYPGANCHQCKTKRPAWEIVTCCNPPHVDTARNNVYNKTKSGYYYCSRCLHNRYNERAINVWGDRNWQCFVCRGTCDCAACNSNSTPLAPGVVLPAGVRGDSTQPGTPTATVNVVKLRPPVLPAGGEVAVAAAAVDSKNRKRKKRKTDSVEAAPAPAAASSDVAMGGADSAQLQPTQHRSMMEERSTDEEEATTTTGTRKSRHAQAHAATAASAPLFAVPQQRGTGTFTPDLRRMSAMRPGQDGGASAASLASDGVGNASWMADMSVGRWIAELQANYNHEVERNELLQREVEELRDMVSSSSSYQDLMRENLQAKMELSSSKTEIARLNTRLRDLERLYEQSSTVVVPNLKKIAKAIATQASVLSKAIPLSLSEIPPNEPPEPPRSSHH